MGEVILHAGMPKTGSTSIQTWLAQHATWLRRTRGVHVLKSRAATGSALFEVFDGGFSAAENGFTLRFLSARRNGDSAAARALLDSFVDEVDLLADSLGSVLLTSETFSGLITEVGQPLLDAFDELGRRQRLRIISYIRPQHDALEARWRQWGHSSPEAPSAWVRGQEPHLDYWSTAGRIAELAPSVRLVLRPFRVDLLHGGDVVRDFAHVALGLSDVPDGQDLALNPAPPLDLANILRAAAALSDTGDGGLTQMRLATLARVWHIPDSAEAVRSRHVLQAFAHRRFEESNRRLIADAGWPTDHFIADPARDVDPSTLGELDELWTPRASATVLAYLTAALEELADRRPRQESQGQPG